MAHPVSYASVAASGPRQTPEEAAAPQPPQLESTESLSTNSLVDVDSESVRTVPSDFMEQNVQTDTQADRLGREKDAAKEKARAEAELAKKKGRRADGAVTRWLASLSDGSVNALLAGNIAAVVGISGWLGFRAWGRYEQGALSWKSVGLGLGVLGAVGAVEGVFAGYLYKAKGKGKKN